MRPAAQETVRVEHVLWDKYEVIRNDFPTDWHWHKFFTSGFHHMHDLKRGSCAFYDYLDARRGLGLADRYTAYSAQRVQDDASGGDDPRCPVA